MLSMYVVRVVYVSDETELCCAVPSFFVASGQLSLHGVNRWRTKGLLCVAQDFLALAIVRTTLAPFVPWQRDNQRTFFSSCAYGF